MLANVDCCRWTEFGAWFIASFMCSPRSRPVSLRACRCRTNADSELSERLSDGHWFHDSAFVHTDASRRCMALLSFVSFILITRITSADVDVI